MAWLAHHPDISWGWSVPSLNQLAKAPEGYLSQAGICRAPRKEPRLDLARAVSSTPDTVLGSLPPCPKLQLQPLFGT